MEDKKCIQKFDVETCMKYGYSEDRKRYNIKVDIRNAQSGAEVTWQ